MEPSASITPQCPHPDFPLMALSSKGCCHANRVSNGYLQLSSVLVIIEIYVCQAHNDLIWMKPSSGFHGIYISAIPTDRINQRTIDIAQLEDK